MPTNERREAAVSDALAGLACMEMETPPGLAERILTALEASPAPRRRAARLAVITSRQQVWCAGRRVAAAADRAARMRAVRTGALASSALVVGAVAVIEARHLRRSREAAA